MERRLSLVKSNFAKHEKRRLPRFPFCYLTFKTTHNKERVFEVKDISFTGMQLALKDGSHSYGTGDRIEGSLHWLKDEVGVSAEVKWVTQNRMGVAFEDQKSFDNVQKLLRIENIVESMRPLHENHVGLELPGNLKYWLRADGPLEIFVWHHSDAEYSKVQMILMEHFIEWEDGRGVQTGRALSKRDVDTPLITEDEFVFAIDESIKEERLEFGLKVLSHIPTDLIDQDALDFMRLKLGAHFTN